MSDASSIDRPIDAPATRTTRSIGTERTETAGTERIGIELPTDRPGLNPGPLRIRLVAFAGILPCSSRPRPGNRRPCTTAPLAHGFVRCSPPRAMLPRRADVRLLERLEQTAEGILDDDDATPDASTTTRKTQSTTTRERAEHIGTHPRAPWTPIPPRKNASRLRTLFRSPPSRRFATARCGRTARRSTRFSSRLVRMPRSRSITPRGVTRTVALVDARARADAESRWVRTRARRCAAEEEARTRARAARPATNFERRRNVVATRPTRARRPSPRRRVARKDRRVAPRRRSRGIDREGVGGVVGGGGGEGALGVSVMAERCATSPAAANASRRATPRTRGRRSRRRASRVRGRRWKPRLESPRRARRRFGAAGNLAGNLPRAPSPRRRRRPSSRKRPPRSSTPRPARASRNTTPRSRTDARRRRRRERRRRRRMRRTRPEATAAERFEKSKARRRLSPPPTREMPPRRARPPPRRGRRRRGTRRGDDSPVVAAANRGRGVRRADLERLDVRAQHARDDALVKEAREPSDDGGGGRRGRR